MSAGPLIKGEAAGMRPFNKQTLVAGLISAAAAGVLAMGSLTAAASAAPNPGPPNTDNEAGPQSANIPYVAWVGEHVRLVACDPSINERDIVPLRRGNIVEEPNELQFVNYQIEDWSGYQFQPPNPDGDSGNNIFEVFEPGPAAFFEPSEPAHEDSGCVATTYKSLNPGLARIRVDVRNSFSGRIVFSHQFLVMWLTANKPTLHEAGLNSGGTEVFQNQLNTTGHYNLSKFLGDPSGNGEFVPSPFSNPNGEEDKGLVQVRSPENSRWSKNRR